MKTKVDDIMTDKYLSRQSGWQLSPTENAMTILSYQKIDILSRLRQI